MGVFDQLDAALASVQPPPKRAALPATTSQALFDPAEFADRSIPEMYVGVEKASAGIEHEQIRLDIRPIFGKDGCAFLRNALGTHGKHHTEPEWQIALLAATFLPKPREFAHELSSGHRDYTPDDTDHKFDIVKHSRDERDLGYPSCDAIENRGCTDCALCPHRGKIRSPLNLGLTGSTVAPVVTFAGKHLYQDEHGTVYEPFDLPDGYAFNQQGYVCVIEKIKDKTATGVEIREELTPLLNEQYILDPWGQINPDAIRFKITGTKKKIREVVLDRGTGASAADTCKRLAEQGVAFNQPVRLKTSEFLMDLLRKIELMRESAEAQAFGWVANEMGEYDTFIFNKRFHRDGTVTPAGYLDERVRDQYRPKGLMDPWRRLVHFLLQQKDRQQYAVVLATAFGAPLIAFTGQPCINCHLYGTDSGTGKSTALDAASSVWGHPVKSRLMLEATQNQVGFKLGVLAHILVVWDEITSSKASDGMADIIMMNGQEKQRLIVKGGILQTRDAGNWMTIVTSTGNASMLDALSAKQPDTPAGRRRVFEMHIAQKNSAVTHWSVQDMRKELQHNFGNAGMIYSRFLAMKSAELPDLFMKRGLAFDALVGQVSGVEVNQEERFWSVFCAACLLGAQFANELALTEFDLPLLEKYLVEQFLAQRTKLVAAGQGGMDTAVELMTAFIKEHNFQMIITDGLPIKGGNPKKLPFQILRAPHPNNQKGLFIQWVKRPGDALLRISRKQFTEWLDRGKRQPSVIFDNIEHRDSNMVTLGGKTQYAMGPERCIDIPVPPGSWLDSALNDLVGDWSSDNAAA